MSRSRTERPQICCVRYRVGGLIWRRGSVALAAGKNDTLLNGLS